MNTILDYMTWRSDIPLDVIPFNEIDAVVFSTMTYAQIDSFVSRRMRAFITLEELANKYKVYIEDKNNRKLGLIIPVENNDLLIAVGESDRFKNLLISGYSNKVNVEHNMQFTAFTIYDPNNKEVFVIFRGTDDTINGWKEDFRMAYKEVVLAQKEAAKYLNRVTSHFDDCSITIMGHSKGGNLAVYAAAKCKKEVQICIKKVYSEDGPGFTKEFLNHQDYKNVDDRIYWYIPTESMIGTLMNHGTNEVIMTTNAKGLFSHSPFSWEVKQGQLVKEETQSSESLMVHQVIEECMVQLSQEDRKLFTTILFDALDATNAKTLSDLKPKDLIKLIDSVKNENETSKELMKQMIKISFSTIVSNFKNSAEKDGK